LSRDFRTIKQSRFELFQSQEHHHVIVVIIITIINITDQAFDLLYLQDLKLFLARVVTGE
jgi:hypothetical protein